MPDKGFLPDINRVLRNQVYAGVVHSSQQKTGNRVAAARNGRQSGLGRVEIETARPIAAVMNILAQGPEFAAELECVAALYPGHHVVRDVRGTGGDIFVVQTR